MTDDDDVIQRLLTVAGLGGDGDPAFLSELIYSAQPESELFSARAAGRCGARPRMSARVLVSGGVVYRLG